MGAEISRSSAEVSLGAPLLISEPPPTQMPRTLALSRLVMVLSADFLCGLGIFTLLSVFVL